jgi:spoIIIJ-associated protein
MREFVATGRTVEEAIEAALQMAGLSRDEAEVEVLDEGSRGLFGLGGREARVRVVPKAEPLPPDEATKAQDVARELLGRMGFEATVRVRPTERGVAVEVEGEDLAALIGRHGQGLQAFEAILALLVARAAGRPVPLEVDIAGYRERRRAQLVLRARKAAEQAVREGRPIHLPPMNARDRRVVHTALAQDPGVATRSEGEGATRHVVVEPKGTRRPPRKRRPHRTDDR